MTQIVVPGEQVPEGVRSNTVKENSNNYSTVVGLLNNDRLIPLKSTYLARRDDVVIGVITETKHSGYIVNLDGPYTGFLASRRNYDDYDIVMAKVSDVNEVGSIKLGYERRLPNEGRLIKVSPAKVARVIGKKNSMIDTIKEKTSTDIEVGKNGIIWIKGDNARKAVDAIRIIEKEAHTSGLTDRIKKFLEKK